MRRGYEWLYLVAAALALIALCIRIYDWLVRGDRADVLGIAVPAIFFAALLVMWRGAQERARKRDDASG